MKRLALVLIAVAASVWVRVEAAEAACPDWLRDRTPDQVVADLRAAQAAADWDAVACNYGKNAFLVDDQGVLVGRAEIVGAIMSLDALFAGIQPEIVDETVFNDVVRVLFRMDGGWIVIEDGVHTYLIRNGKIRRQTSHGVIDFTGPPPDSN